MKTMYRYMRPHLPLLILTLLLKLAAAMLDLLIPSFLARIIDRAVPMGNKEQIYIWGAFMLVCAVLSLVFNQMGNRISADTSGKITQVVRHDLFEKLTHLSERQLDEVSLPSAVSRLTSDTYHLNNMLNRVQRLGIRAPILLIGGIGITLAMDPALTLVLIATLPFISMVVFKVTKKSVPLYKEQQGILDRMIRTVQENITGIRIIKALSKGEHEKKRFDGVSRELVNKEWHVGSVLALTNPLTGLILNLGLTMVIVAGAYLVANGRTTTGNIIAFLNYFTLILMAMLGISRIFMMVSKGAASAGRIEEVLLLKDDMPLVLTPQVETPHHIEMQDVSFSYGGKENHLSHVSFSLKHGETLGILGETGSGKTTLVHLLLRLYDVTEGRVLINGRDVRSIPEEELHGLFGVAFQNDFVMSGTLKENIDYFRSLPDDRLKEAVVAAQAGDFVFEKGMDYLAAVRGNNLSGGQKQRILLARALADKPGILILDDSSSALDYKTDARLRQALYQDYKECTKVIVAQRISSVKGADHILVLEDGQVIGSGKHDQLLENCLVYQEIYKLQMGEEAVKHHE